MHEAHSVIGAILCVYGDRLPERVRELDQYLQIISEWVSEHLAAVYFFQSSERYRVDCGRYARVQLPDAFFVLLQPAQRRRDHNVVEVLLLTIGSSQTDRTIPTYPSFHRFHHSVELNVRLCKRNRRDPGHNLLVVGGYEAVVCKI